MITKYGFIYITTNTANGKQYIGKRSYMKNGWERYLGSGKLLLRAIRKYGRTSFSREIIYESFSKEDLDAAERSVIRSLSAVESEAFYNLSPGGSGTSFGFMGKKHSADTRARMCASARKENSRRQITDKLRKATSENGKNSIGKLIAYRRSIGYQTGAEHPRSIPVTVDGVLYNSVSAAKEAGYRYKDIKALIAGEVSEIDTSTKGRGPAKAAHLFGVHYQSIAAACRALGLTRREVKALTENATYTSEYLGGPQTSSTA
jgi:group I intron endonuclease